MDEGAGRYLVALARGTIRKSLGLEVPADSPDVRFPGLEIPGASFVTLTRKGALRGCMGSLTAWRPLREDVADNALAAAFRDPRFPALRPEEEALMDLEVSVLSAPEEVRCTPGRDILDHLEPGVHGVILTCRGRRSTFLPQVWDQLPDKVVFLEHLCRKAGLEPGAWMGAEARFQVYRVEKWIETGSGKEKNSH